ncbi:uncharacterized [Tachysurus ichikawai]
MPCLMAQGYHSPEKPVPTNPLILQITFQHVQWFTTRFCECQAKGLPYLSRKEASIKVVALPLQPTSEEEVQEEVWNQRDGGLQRDTVY